MTRAQSVAVAAAVGVLVLLAILWLVDATWLVLVLAGLLLLSGVMAGGVLLYFGGRRVMRHRRHRQRRFARRSESKRASEPPRVAGAWTEAWLQQLSSRRLRRLCAEFWVTKAYTVERAETPGVELLIRQKDDVTKTLAVIHCLPAAAGAVSVAAVEALGRERDRQSASLAVFYAMAGFTPDALALRSDRKLKLIAAKDLLDHVGSLAPEAQQALLAQISRSTQGRRLRRRQAAR
jgi:hypothetical protein